MMYAPLAFLLIAQPVLAKPIRRAPQPVPAVPVVLSDEQVLKNVHLDPTAPGLMAFFRFRVMPSVNAEQTAKLTKQLSESDQAIHSKAMAELIGLGPLAVPALRRAINHAGNEETLTRPQMPGSDRRFRRFVGGAKRRAAAGRAPSRRRGRGARELSAVRGR